MAVTLLQVSIAILLLPLSLFYFLFQQVKQSLFFLLSFNPPLLLCIVDSICPALRGLGSPRFMLDFATRRLRRRWYLSSSKPASDCVQQPFFGLIDVGSEERGMGYLIGKTGATVN